ncbi:hypothetical protein DLM78_22865 [Leptospira stimsonii]|uniref:Uncharacterized protein n=1 Tax=Leptospira stimsonii TaxID=2202203 RepID=A0A8B3CHF9_9LEPT|nr:hypothetical protein DLM78_22865 [Leptospira stimsonii]
MFFYVPKRSKKNSGSSPCDVFHEEGSVVGSDASFSRYFGDLFFQLGNSYIGLFVDKKDGMIFQIGKTGWSSYFF